MNNEQKPLPAFTTLQNLMNHFFEDPFPSFFYQPFRVDMYDMGSKIVVEAELPGFEQNQIKIEVIHEGIKIIAEDNRELETIDEAKKYFKKERNVHRVERIISLPYEVSANTKAHYRNGILEIHIPKDAPHKQHYIKIE